MITLKIVAWGIIAAGAIIALQEIVAMLARRVALTHLWHERAVEDGQAPRAEPRDDG